ncbi:hypothetical protein OSH11_13640 [Kaistia dalseonensis]|uniref:Uncharacterized protein n=1 Tax=Kaistia dalseonensis TaxID=410840 RepID=A0ABU0H7R4_9HYPH|nr:hypothetical protein [Kaistia dalseonensis]MCX5495751.1 hypothetical protein [Kaistia dalseonensis]MDQ0438351.1 hypothetical protein [Kaistia dalseonensis]
MAMVLFFSIPQGEIGAAKALREGQSVDAGEFRIVGQDFAQALSGIRLGR